MRRLACFSFAYAAGAFLGLLGLSRMVSCVLTAVLLLLTVLFALLKGRRERAAAICMAGLAVGFLASSYYRAGYLSKVESCAGEDREIRLELSDYPRESSYGSVVYGSMEENGVRFRVLVYLGEYEEDWKPGDLVTGTGTLTPADDEDGDTRWSYRSIGVPMRASIFEDLEVLPAEKVPIRYLPACLSKSLRDATEPLFPNDVYGYVQALLTGNKSGLTYQQESNLKVAGVYHALAVSGMHVGILMSILSFLTMRHRRLYPLIGIPVLVFYCLMIGGSASVIRASVMQAFLMMGALFRRESDAPTSMGASLMLLTMINPWCLLHIGLQLSFLSTVGILVFSPRIHTMLLAWKPKRLKGLWYSASGMIATTLAALVLTTPLMAFYFGMISLFTVLANLLMIQAITISFALGFVVYLLALASPAAAAVPAFAVTWLLRYVDACAAWIARVPFSALYPNDLYLILWAVFAYITLVFLLLRGRKTKKSTWMIGVGTVVSVLCISLLCSWMEGFRNRVTFTALDVGQGQCLYYQSENRTAAVDCGGTYGEEAGETLSRALLSDGYTTLDYLILTHYDEDHTGGLRQLLNRVEVGMILMPDYEDENGVRTEIEALAASAGTELCFVTEDAAVAFGGGILQIFAPVSRETGNASSLSVLAAFDDFEILVTGDMAMNVEERLLEHHDLPDVEILVAGHHGSRYSTGQELLDAVRPEILVISVGDNSYGHPDESVIARAEESGAKVLRTDRDGTVTIRR